MVSILLTRYTLIALHSNFNITLLCEILTFFICIILIQALDHAGFEASTQNLPISDLDVHEKRRLKLAAVSAQSPSVILLDNPTMTKSGALPDSEIRKFIEFVLKSEKTFVVKSSDVDFLNSFSDNILNVKGDGTVELHVGSLTSFQNILAERETGGVAEVTGSDVRFALFLLFLLCPFEALIFYLYQ